MLLLSRLSTGNGGSSYPTPLSGNFYGSLADQLRASNLFTEVHSTSMPDPTAAHRNIWLPHLTDTIKVDSQTIIIGHSSGTEAAMRLAETESVYGIVLVAACHTDLGDAGERESGWYPPSGGPWLWESIKANSNWIVQFHSTDDPFIGVDESRHVASMLESEYYEMEGMSHFFEPFDEVFMRIKDKIQGKISGKSSGNEL